MQRKVATSFRLFEETLERIDKLVADPPDYLQRASIGPVADRTDVVERLVLLAYRELPAEDVADEPPARKPGKQKPTGRGQRARPGGFA